MIKDCMLIKILIVTVSVIFGFGCDRRSANAGKLFKAGHFLRAKDEYSVILKKYPDNLQALIYMGYLALLENSLDESEQYFLKADKIKPGLASQNSLFADLYYRRNDFAKAAPFFRYIGREAMAKKLESFTGIVPYKTDADFDMAVVRFKLLDPLPVVEAKINGKYTGNFLLDTGGGELILDRAFEEKLQITDSYGTETSVFGGGKKDTIAHTRISSIVLGGHSVKNIPAISMNLTHVDLGGIKLDGVIGTVFLYQFVSTIDYKNRRLILRNKSKYEKSDTQNSAVSVIMPFYMAGDHYMLAHGTVNNSETMLFFVDTGLGGNAFTCPNSTLKKAGLTYDKNNVAKAPVGCGFIDAYPFGVGKLCLQGLCRENLHGLFGPFPPSLEKSFGFDINGLISHEFFRTHSLTIDFERMQLIID